MVTTGSSGLKLSVGTARSQVADIQGCSKPSERRPSNTPTRTMTDGLLREHYGAFNLRCRAFAGDHIALGRSLRPFHFRRHRRQDGIHIATGFQPEDGAAVVEQIEFDVTSAPDQLFFAISRA